MVEVACIGEGRESDSASEEGAEGEAARQSLEAERELAQVLAKQGEKEPGETYRSRPRATDPQHPPPREGAPPSVCLGGEHWNHRAGYHGRKEVLSLDRIVDGGDSPQLRLQHSTNMSLSYVLSVIRGSRYTHLHTSGETPATNHLSVPLGAVSCREGRRGPCLASISINTTIDPPLGTCFNCWQDSHAWRACPRPKVARYCLTYGCCGVDLYSCPRCVPAHARYVLEKYGTWVDSPAEVVARREVPPQREESSRRTRSPSNAEIASTPVPPPIEEEPYAIYSYNI